MATYPDTIPEAAKKNRNLVEMNWDPITRIVGSLGIFTKIDFKTGKLRSATARRPFFAATAFS